MDDQPAIFIESKLKPRPEGTVVEIDGTEYRFQMGPNKREICRVENPDHVERFLSITEGYRMYRPPSVALPPDVNVDALSDTVDAANVDALNAQVSQAIEVQKQNAVVSEGASQPVQADTDNDPQQSDPTAENAEKALEDMSDEELRATFEAELKRAPHPRAKNETIIAQIEAYREAQAETQ